jgi:hypothetical protein
MVKQLHLLISVKYVASAEPPLISCPSLVWGRMKAREAVKAIEKMTLDEEKRVDNFIRGLRSITL